MNLLRFSMIAALVMLTTNAANAAFQLRAGTGGAPGANGAVIDALSPGATIQLFLVENTGTAFTVQGASFSLTRAGNATESSFSANPSFLANSVTGANPYTVTNSFGSVGSTGTASLQWVQVAQFNSSVPLLNSAQYSFSDINDFAQFSINNVSNDAQDKAIIAASSPFTAVPEPSSMLVVGGLGAVLAFRRRRAG